MKPARFTFGEYRPDIIGPASTLNVADNVLPGVNGYGPVPAFVALPGTALPSRPLGGGTFRSATRITFLFAGTATSLYRYSAAGWASVGSGFAASDDNPWVFKQFGQWVIATNGADAPQYFDMAGTATAFTPLPGIGVYLPPRLSLLAVVRDFVVGGVVDGNSSVVQWSGINNAKQWRPGYGQSDYNPAATGGAITAIAGGEYGLVFQEERISRMTYVAGNVIFQFDEISPNIGCIHPRSFAQVGRNTYFLSQRGFMLCDGNSVTPIGDQAVDATFLAALSRPYMGRMSCVADPVRKIIYWSVPAAAPDTWFAYSWAQNKWSRVLAPASLMMSGRTRDISIDEEYGSPDTTYDEGLAFDDPSYIGGDPIFYLFDASFQIGALTGANMAAVLAMGPQELVQGALARIRRWRLGSDAVAGVTLRVDVRQRMGDTAAVKVFTGPVASGDIVGRCRGRTAAMRVELAAGTAWTFLQYLDVTEFEVGGMR